MPSTTPSYDALDAALTELEALLAAAVADPSEAALGAAGAKLVEVQGLAVGAFIEERSDLAVRAQKLLSSSEVTNVLLQFRDPVEVLRSGTTAERTAADVDEWPVGSSWFDTTLGRPVWLKTPGSAAWVDADGTTA